MASATMISKVKTALRISHSLLDTEIGETIDAAVKELERVGVSLTWRGEDDDLVNMAIKTYCKAAYTENQDDAGKYMESFKQQAEDLRKSEGYRRV